MLKEELYENLFPVTNAALNGKVVLFHFKATFDIKNDDRPAEILKYMEDAFASAFVGEDVKISCGALPREFLQGFLVFKGTTIYNQQAMEKVYHLLDNYRVDFASTVFALRGDSWELEYKQSMVKQRFETKANFKETVLRNEQRVLERLMSEDPFEPRPSRNRGSDIPAPVEEPKYEREDDGLSFDR